MVRSLLPHRVAPAANEALRLYFPGKEVDDFPDVPLLPLGVELHVRNLGEASIEESRGGDPPFSPARAQALEPDGAGLDPAGRGQRLGMDGGKAHQLTLHLPFDHQIGPPALHGSLKPARPGHIPQSRLRIFPEDQPSKLLLHRVHVSRFAGEAAHHEVGIPGPQVLALERAPEGCAFGDELPDHDGVLIHGYRRPETEGQLSGSRLRHLPGGIHRSGHQQGIRERHVQICVQGDARAERGRGPEQSLEDGGQRRVVDGQCDLRRVCFARLHLDETQGGGPPGDEPFGRNNFEPVGIPVDDSLPVA